jgi:hypothetical protein
LESFVSKAVALLESGIHLLVVDLFPPGRFDPHGLHHAVWSCLGDHPTKTEANKPLTVVSYSVGEDVTAYLNTLQVGDELPPAPVFLQPERYVSTPLEATYQTTWAELPPPVRELFG